VAVAVLISVGALIAAPRAAAAPQVKYDVWSDGPLSTLTYIDPMGNEGQITDIKPPWTFSFMGGALPDRPNPLYRVGAQTVGSLVGCRILVNDVVRDKKVVSGANAVVSCSASLFAS